MFVHILESLCKSVLFQYYLFNNSDTLMQFLLKFCYVIFVFLFYLPLFEI